MPSDQVIRGSVFMIDYFDEENNPIGEKPVVIVSNNGRNAKLDNYLAVRITTSAPIQGLQSHVPLDSPPIVGHARCDDILIVYKDELKRMLGYVTITDLASISSGLRCALAI